MLISLRAFFATVIVFSSLKDSNSFCRNKNSRVTCESVRYVSKAVIGRIPNISEVTFITIKSSPDLEIFPEAFQSAVNLWFLRIENNKIIKLYNNSFQNVPLTYISLVGNGIKSFPSGTLSNLPLQSVRLENNSLSEVPKGFASSLHSLTLTNNNIESIDNRALENLPNLNILHLKGNKIQSIFPHRILTYPEVLVSLNLANNSVTRITNYMLQELDSLYTLNLEYNSIYFIEANSFEHTPQLKILVLSNNDLKNIDENVFPSSGMPALIAMYLDNNRLMYLSSDLFVRAKSLERISIVGNPWLCSCLIALERLLEECHIYAEENCTEDYYGGKRPICVGYKTSGSRCTYVYNNRLSKKYITHRNKYSVTSSRSCSPLDNNNYFYPRTIL